MSLLRSIVKKFAPLSAEEVREMQRQGLDPTKSEDRASYKRMMDQVVPQTASQESRQGFSYTIKPGATQYKPTGENKG